MLPQNLKRISTNVRRLQDDAGWVLRAVPGQQKQQIVVAVTNESGVVGCGGRSALLR